MCCEYSSVNMFTRVMRQPGEHDKHGHSFLIQMGAHRDIIKQSNSNHMPSARSLSFFGCWHNLLVLMIPQLHYETSFNNKVFKVCCIARIKCKTCVHLVGILSKYSSFVSFVLATRIWFVFKLQAAS